MSLNVVIVGAGIAGLVAASSLRQAGHRVVVLEKSALTSVIGAALQVTPNGGRVLAHLGFDTVRAQACRPHHWDILRGDDLTQLSSIPLSATPGHPEPGTLTVHRGDLHQELMRLATTEEGAAETSWGPPVSVRPGSTVRCVSEDGNGVVLESGEEVRGDLLIAADGVHSVLRNYVTQESGKAVHSGMAAFRFLLDSDQMRADKELASLLETSEGVANLLADTTEKVKERHMVWYECRGGKLQNFVGIHPSTITTIENATDELKTAMMTEFGHFDSRIRKIIALSSHLQRWPLFIYDPLHTWVRGRVVLIGDAAHPMLPFSGQGAAQGIEDGAALGCLLKGQNEATLESALYSFETVRKSRASRVQVLSNVRAGRESEVAERLMQYLDETAPKPPMSHVERVQHDFRFEAPIHLASAAGDEFADNGSF